ncbi:MAG: leucyl aminopeptidase family protein [Alphaproteobacteria bacterium]|nr:leucyl aminopeptidase family protein [Alphaproteobacteria bacterium]
MASMFVARADARTVPIEAIETGKFPTWLRGADASVKAWVESTGFNAEAGSVSLVAGAGGKLARVLVGVEAGDPIWAFAGLPGQLPTEAGRSYALSTRLKPPAATRAALGWALGSYGFTRYKKPKRTPAALVWPIGVDRARVEREAEAIAMVRDLINTPAGDLGPKELAEAARGLARKHGAKFSVIVGDDLLRRNYPSIHAVGRAASNGPRLIDIIWGRPNDPKVTLVGKGVCFDSGGLDIKSSANMLMMKKDMGGAAHVLGLGALIMGARLPVRLRMLVPAVENMIAGNAFHPWDIIRTRKGITVEIGNTDAEGRIILCDALAEAVTEKPELLIDFATLTGAARVALGPELPVLFCNNERLAGDLLRHGKAENDQIWRLPLWQPYRKMLESKAADISSTGSSPHAGSITAALYLESFVDKAIPWAHFDIMAWNVRAMPGRPEGGEAQGMRAVYALIAERFGRRRKHS